MAAPPPTPSRKSPGPALWRRTAAAKRSTSRTSGSFSQRFQFDRLDARRAQRVEKLAHYALVVERAGAGDDEGPAAERFGQRAQFAAAAPAEDDPPRAPRNRTPYWRSDRPSLDPRVLSS